VMKRLYDSRATGRISPLGLMGLSVCALTFSVVLPLMLTPLQAGAATASQVKQKLLSVSDLPDGWSVQKGNSGGGSVSDLGGCFKGLSSRPQAVKGVTRAEIGFVDGIFPAAAETLEEGKIAAARYTSFEHTLSKCSAVSVTANGIKVSGTVGALSVPTIGNASAAYAINFTASGETLGIDLILFKEGSTFGLLSYESLGSPTAAAAESLAAAAAEKAQGEPVTPLSSGGVVG
jgi:hypothetical protein